MYHFLDKKSLYDLQNIAFCSAFCCILPCVLQEIAVRFATKCNAFCTKTQNFQHPLVGIFLLQRTKNGRYFLQKEMQNHSK